MDDVVHLIALSEMMMTVPRRREDDARSFDLFKQAQTMSRELIVLPDDTPSRCSAA